MGSNVSLLRSKYGINFQSHSLAHCITVATTVEHLDLLRSRCNEYVINGFTNDEITVLIREIVSH